MHGASVREGASFQAMFGVFQIQRYTFTFDPAAIHHNPKVEPRRDSMDVCRVKCMTCSEITFSLGAPHTYLSTHAPTQRSDDAPIILNKATTHSNVPKRVIQSYLSDTLK